MDRRQQFSDQVLDRRQQFSDAWVLFGVQIVTLRPIFSKTRHVAHRVTYTTEKSSFRTIIWASMSKRVYFPFKVLKCNSFYILNSWEQNPFSVLLFGSNDSFTIDLFWIKQHLLSVLFKTREERWY